MYKDINLDQPLQQTPASSFIGVASDSPIVGVDLVEPAGVWGVIRLGRWRLIVTLSVCVALKVVYVGVANIDRGENVFCKYRPIGCVCKFLMVMCILWRR